MIAAKLTIDLSAIATNWKSLDRLSTGQTGAVVKANAYGLGIEKVAPTLAKAGARQFFVAQATEGLALRQTLGAAPDIYVFAGHMPGDSAIFREANLIPLINSGEQLQTHLQTLTGHPFGIQLDSGMNRLGMEPAEWAALRDTVLEGNPKLIMSHLACADEPDHQMNQKQLTTFLEMTDGINVPRSLAATGGTILGTAYHFNLTRPGIGLYGGLPFENAQPVVTLDLPVIQIRDVAPGETVGYANSWTAKRPTRLATVSSGYADGLIRAMGPNLTLTSDGQNCPAVGRVSMDLITVDVTDLDHTPTALQILGAHQSIDQLANAAHTIGYEVLTSLGNRYQRNYIN